MYIVCLLQTLMLKYILIKTPNDTWCAEMAKRRQKGSGYIFKRGNYYYLQISIAGKLKVISLKTANLVEAEAKAKDYRPAIDAETKEDVARYVAKARKLAKAGSVKLSDAWSLYFKSTLRPDSSPGTLRNYERNLCRFISWLAHNEPNIQTMAQVGEDIAERYSKELWASKVSGSTFNYHIQSLGLVFRVLATAAGLELNPWKSIKRKNENKMRRKEFTADQINSIFTVLQDASFRLMHREETLTLCHIGAYSGLRLADAALLKWESVSLLRNIIRLIPIKTHRIQREVVIPILMPLQSKLKEAKAWRNENGYVLPKIAERYQRNPDGVSQDIQHVIESAGIKTTPDLQNGAKYAQIPNLYGFHSFRHYFATQCADKGIPAATVAAILGDNISTVEKYYVHEVEENRQRIGDALNISEPPAQLLLASETDVKKESLIHAISTHLAKMDDQELIKIAKSFGLDIAGE